MATLAQLLGFMERDDISEIVLQNGVPPTALRGTTYTPLFDGQISLDQIHALVADTPLANKLPGPGQPKIKHSFSLGKKRYSASMEHTDNALRLRFRADAAKPRAAVIGSQPRAAAPTPAPEPSATPEPTPELAPQEERSPSRQIGLVSLLRGATGGGQEPTPVAAAPAFPAPAESSAPVTTKPDEMLLYLLKQARAAHASDVHVMGDRRARVRRVGQLVPVGEAMPRDRVDSMLRSLLPPAMASRLDDVGYVDLSLDVPEAGRMRVNIGRQASGLKGCFRLVVNGIPTLEALGLPEELGKVVGYHQGLAIVSGPNGHGKTTTMAALVDMLNSQKPVHIVTVEDPVEVIHPPKRALISHREVRVHTRSFARALKGALRQDPDVIVIGELRDVETVEIALTAAETGHLVIATMSTRSGAKTIDRLIDLFPPHDQPQVRATLAGALKIIVSQRLLPNAAGNGMVAAAELITGSVPLWNLIRDDKLLQLPSLQQRGRTAGMIRFDDSLAELVQAGRITKEVALERAESVKQLEALLA